MEEPITETTTEVFYKKTTKSGTFAPVPNWIMVRKELSPGAKLHYGRLRQYQGKHISGWPKLETLAKEEGCSVRQIQNYNKELIKFKLIQTTRRGLSKSNLYVLLDHEWKRDWQSAATHNQQHPAIHNQQYTATLDRQYPSIPIVEENNRIEQVKERIKEREPTLNFSRNSIGVGLDKKSDNYKMLLCKYHDIDVDKELELFSTLYQGQLQFTSWKSFEHWLINCKRTADKKIVEKNRERLFLQLQQERNDEQDRKNKESLVKSVAMTPAEKEAYNAEQDAEFMTHLDKIKRENQEQQELKERKNAEIDAAVNRVVPKEGQTDEEIENFKKMLERVKNGQYE